MTLVEDGPSAASLTTHSPVDGSEVATYPVAGEGDVDAAVQRARDGARWWRDQGFSARRAHLLHWKSIIANHADELAGVIASETGKPHGDAVLEVMLALGHLDWAAKNARRC